MIKCAYISAVNIYANESLSLQIPNLDQNYTY